MPVAANAVIHLVFFAGLVYGAAVVFRNWRQTVPEGCDSDFEFAHHRKLM